MKKTLLFILVFPLLIISCTTEENVSEELKNKTAKMLKIKKILLQPANTANPYDDIGKQHNDVLEIYLATYPPTDSTGTIMSQVQLITLSNTFSIKQDCNSPYALEAISAILANPQNYVTSTIENSTLTTPAKTSLSDFINSWPTLQTQDFESIYQFIITFESGILTNSLLTSEDKRIILTASTIARYSFYYKECKDRDWDTTVGNSVGGIVGALNDSLSPVTMALVTGIAQYNLNVHR
ncbi:hypothetical protein [Flavobacterium hydatis]|jgi:hypothetical protein|uniref:Lipoprotein n=1 Tax=Flavobacterium hydatis TaxID=991 RepID=A0A086AIR0_FLAHY|nr:hypothetical protein [Flavobacterium hydatis]KFF16574.1 hypothetical protein IW20_10425 [Flavobacterium hydatis]OXA90232.1 hypothetical protein B0A62_19355 [Flavobacterium hydatis]